MADLVIAKRKEKKLTQAQLAEMTGIHRAMISRLEALDYIPSIDQLQAIAEALGFEVTDLFEEEKPAATKPVLDKKFNIAVAGTGYVGLSIATLLSQHNHVTAVDIIPEKVELINNKSLRSRMITLKNILLKKSWILPLHWMAKKHISMPIS